MATATVALVAWMLVTAAPEPVRDDRLASVLAAVRARESKARTLDCRWIEERFYPKGSLQHWGDEEVGGDTETSDAAPPEDTTVQSEFRMLLGAGRMRYDWRAMLWNFDERAFGQDQSSGAASEAEARDIPLGDRGASVRQRGDGQTLIEFKPVLYAYRLLDPLSGVDLGRLRVEGEAVDRGLTCVVLEEEPHTLPNPCERWWLAEAMDYAVVRWQYVGDDEEVLLDCPMGYGDKTEGIWPLRSWDLHERVMSSRTNTVAELSLNEPAEPSEFSVQFPPGTKVFDEIRGLQYTAGGQDDPAVQHLTEEAAMDAFIAQAQGEPPRPGTSAPQKPGAGLTELPRRGPSADAQPPMRGAGLGAAASSGGVPLLLWLGLGGLAVLTVAAVVLGRAKGRAR